jgi:NDP-sugar pyrophosphorylase family protein
MTDLIKEIVRKGLPIATFPIHEYWIDIGEFEELKKANKVIQQDIKKGKGKRG